MTTYFVTRHKGAIDWARSQGIEAEHIAHLDIEIIEQGDVVLGTLPVSVVAQVCARGGRYFHLTLDMPADKRGKEWTATDMENHGAKLEEFRAKKVGDKGK